MSETSTSFLSLGDLTLREGGKIPDARLAYATWGHLNADRSNAILLFHALSGTHHASGSHPSSPEGCEFWNEELHEGWWSHFIGPGKAIDTDHFFVICPNYLGGCYGSTGPSSMNPETGKQYGAAFPHLNVSDLVDASVPLLDEFKIEKLHSVMGPSVGGLLTLTFATRHAERVRNVIPIASGFKTTVLNRLILFEQILAIENDPHFNGGDYYETGQPRIGLALARMISHKTFVHLDTFERRARQKLVKEEEMLSWFQVRDTFQSYMLHQGKKFTERFDANTYLRIIDMWSRYNAVIEGEAEDAAELIARSKAAGHRYLVFSIDSDFCFYPEEQAELVRHLEAADVPTMHITVHSAKGHDSFLLEPELYTPHIQQMLSEYHS
ncbi:MAG: homoserine O-acetyltransferase MetX [Akkermansiaceae bacterium]|nr:homoserine O-acetyltransferase [Akkermansiaceae bacterium]